MANSPGGWQNGAPWQGDTGAWAGGLAWQAPTSVQDTNFPGKYNVGSEKSVIDPTTYFTGYLGRFGGWGPSRTQGRTPRVVQENEFRFLSLQRGDFVTVRTDMGTSEPAGTGYQFVNMKDYVTVRCLTRLNQMQGQLMLEEVMRLLNGIRTDPYGVLPGDGRDWLKVIEIQRSELSTRAQWHSWLVVEVNRRWVPLQTTR